MPASRATYTIFAVFTGGPWYTTISFTASTPTLGMLVLVVDDVELEVDVGGLDVVLLLVDDVVFTEELVLLLDVLELVVVPPMTDVEVVDDVVVLVVLDVVVLLVVEVVVVVPPTSSASRMLSLSRSMPIRMPEPGGTHVYVSS